MQNLKEFFKNNYSLELGNKIDQGLTSLKMEIEEINFSIWPIHKNLTEISEINIGFSTEEKEEIIRAYNLIINKFKIETPNISNIIKGATITFSIYDKYDDSGIILTTHDKISSMSDRFEIRLTLMKY